MKGIQKLVLWQQMIRPGELAGLARAAGFGCRHRLLTPIRHFWALTLGFEVGSLRSLAPKGKVATASRRCRKRGETLALVRLLP